MGCNFNIAASIQLMIQYEIAILAIQEHTPWNRKLLDMEIMSIEQTCHRWGFLVKISELQILIIDKQLASCYRDTVEYENGRALHTWFEISLNCFVNFISAYGIPHSPDNPFRQNYDKGNENTTL